MSLGSVIFISVCVVFVVLLFSGVMYRFALYYRDQVKTLKKQVHSLKERAKEIKTDLILGNRNIIDECGEDIKKYEEEIKELKQNIEEYEEALRERDYRIHRLTLEAQSRDEEIERLKDELKQRGESVKENSHKNKKKSK